MKFWAIFRFELAYQLRRGSTWLFFAVVVVVPFLMVSQNNIHDARRGDYLLNAPFVIAAVTVFGCAMWLLVAASIAGEAAARDVQTRMHPLTYTAPVRTADYLGGRFLAAFVLNALMLLAVPVSIMLAMRSPGVEAELLGPFRPAAYLSAFAFVALPNAFVGTAIQYSLATLSRRVIASYLGSVLLIISAWIVGPAVGFLVGRELGLLLDPIGTLTIVAEVFNVWTPIEQASRLIALEGLLLWNRLLWVGVALGMLVFTHATFRFVHPAASPWWTRGTQRRDTRSATPAAPGTALGTANSIPQVRRTFGFATHMRQTIAIAWRSFRKIATVRVGPVLLTALAMLLVLSVPEVMKFMGVPVFPRTEHVITYFTGPLANLRNVTWTLVQLFTILYAGELIWWDRETGVSEMTGAAPVPDWVPFLGRFLGLGLLIVAWLALLMAAGILAQVSLGYFDLEIGLYLRIFFGLELPNYLLFAMLALVVHVVVNQKHIGHLVAFSVYLLIAFAPRFGIEHNLLIYGSDPGWSYTDMRGFGPFLGPFMWFKLYWAAWALLLAVVARLLWARGTERGLNERLQAARRRVTRPTAWTAAAAVGLILTVGGFIFYNTNVLNEYQSASDRMERSAEYERRYAGYSGIPQPRLAGATLNVEIYPERREVDISGTYRLVNIGAVPIDSIHLATAVEPREVDFDRSSMPVLEDEDLGHRIYALDEPLEPGDSLLLDFEMRVEPNGFRNRGVDASVAANGTVFANPDWLPLIGYQARRELTGAGIRRAHGLPARPDLPSLYDIEARRNRSGAERIALDAVVGTAEGQIAVAPGALRRTWTEAGRRYFHYSTDAPIGLGYAFYSANYAVHEGQWNDVAIRILHHPEHTANLDAMVNSVQASLTYFTEQFGPYPHRHITIVERPGHGFELDATSAGIAYDEGFSLLNPERDPRSIELPFYVMAHEVAHQWWGGQLSYAPVEGVWLLGEALASYSAYLVVEHTYGADHLRRILSQLRASYQVPRTRAAVPLLQANDPFQGYRKGPFAMYALSRYIGEGKVNEALRQLLEKHGSGVPPLPTSLDLYRELQAVTPDSLQYLLHDLFEANTYWELETERATAVETEAGIWQVTLDVKARKEVVDAAGVETSVPIDDWVQIGVFAPAERRNGLGEPIYMQMHRIRSAEQRITVTVPRRPAEAGIDPNHLLIDWETNDNFEEVRVER